MNTSALSRFSIHMACFVILPLIPLACSNGNGNTTANASKTADPHADTPITASSVPRIRKGMSINQLREAVRDSTPARYRYRDEDDQGLEDWMKVARDMETPLEHQFTMNRNGDIITCVAAQLFDNDPSLKMTFVFRNGTLEKFMPDPPSQWRRAGTHDGAAVMEIVIDPDVRIEQILESHCLSDEEFITYVVEKANASIESTRKHSEPLPPLAQAMAQAFMKPSARDLEISFENHEKFDGLKVTLGMSADDVNALFGQPKYTQESESGTRRIYGAPVGDGFWPYRPVLVEFSEDKARAVLSGPQFIDLEQYFGPRWPEHRGKVPGK